MAAGRLAISLFVLLLLGAASCAFEPREGTNTCFTDDDCLVGRTCYQGACVDRLPSGRVDLGGADAGAADFGEVDLGADVGVPVDMNVTQEQCGMDSDGDGFLPGGSQCTLSPEMLDCNDGDRNIFPGAATRCNGEDNNCDGAPDTDGCECIDGYVSSCGSAIGLCEPGTRVCINGGWGPCTGDVGPADEACDGEDNDCDGTADEGCSCQPGQSKPCGTEEGECSAGTQNCVNGAWSTCRGGIGPKDETCNGLDDDCDGTRDNNLLDEGGSCATGQEGVCAAGAETCIGGTLTCQRISNPGAETCDGRDNNCDGRVDENIVQSCMSACGPGSEICANGSFVECTPSNAPAEVCNGVDDDCDNLVDESFPGEGASCDTGLSGVCAPGALACVAEGEACVPNVMPVPETCDGVDNDCDGLVDEDANGVMLVEACGGSCPTRSVRVCLNGTWSACERDDMEVCDNGDTNCDGAVDNQAVCYRACPGGGVAEGTLDCTSNACELPVELCGDGIDNDCDGAVDENGCNDDYDDMIFVPGGTFLMGAISGDTVADNDEKPLHVVELDPFYVDRYEVTRAEYAACIVNGACSPPPLGCPLQPTVTQGDKPIACVSWAQANAYCSWAGKRLPTEAEWEKAARGPFARTPLFPWGNSVDGSRAVMGCTDSQNQCVEPVDTFPRGVSYYGLHHMAGNVAEWVADFYDAGFYTSNYTVNPSQTVNQNLGRSIRGGSYAQGLEFGRTSNRAQPAFLFAEEVGFRCAR